MSTVTAKITADGLWAWMDVSGKGASNRLREMIVEAHAVAFAEFVSGGKAKGSGKHDMDGGLGLRFSPRAYDVLGLTRRSDMYIKRKHKIFGRDLPYVSPSKRGHVHMRDLLKFRGTGWQVRPTKRGDVVTTKMTFPGLRRLNHIRAPFGQIYRDEFLQLRGRAKHQFNAIVARANEIFWQNFQASIQATGKHDL